MSLSSPDDSSLSSILLLSSSADPFDYPDYSPVPSCTSSKPSVNILIKSQSHLHRYQLFRVIPTPAFSVHSSQHSIPPSVENLVFQEGIPIRIVRSQEAKELESSVTFNSFVVYCVTGTMVSVILTRNSVIWIFSSILATSIREGETGVFRFNGVYCGKAGDEYGKMKNITIDERIRTGFEASIKNYAKSDCVLFFQSSLSLITSLPYSKSINRLLLYFLIPFVIPRSIYDAAFTTHSPIESFQLIGGQARLKEASQLQQLTKEVILRRIVSNIIHCTPLPELGDTVMITVDEVGIHICLF